MLFRSKQRPACSKFPFEPGLPGLPGRKAVTIEERAEACLPEARAHRLRRGGIRPRVAQKDVVSFVGAHEVSVLLLNCIVMQAQQRLQRSCTLEFHRRTTAHGATDAFGRRPLSRASRPFMGPILKGSKGSILLKKSLAAMTRC